MTKANVYSEMTEAERRRGTQQAIRICARKGLLLDTGDRGVSERTGRNQVLWKRSSTGLEATA